MNGQVTGVNYGKVTALMLDPERVFAIVSQTAKAIRKPVTVKIRKGFDDAHVNAVEIARVAEAAGAAAVAPDVSRMTRAQREALEREALHGAKIRL